MYRSFLSPLVATMLLTTTTAALAEDAPKSEGGKIAFKKTQLDTAFRGEGVAVGDFNRDGKMDIASGTMWYEAPDWKPHVIFADGKEYDPKGYSDCFNAWAADINGDGWTDVLEISWPGKEAVWFENPQNKEGPWTRHVATPVASNESPQFVDVDGDGKRELVMAYASSNPDGPDRRMGIARPGKDPTKPWDIEVVSAEGAPSTQRYAHGLGVGDVNDDGRNDIVVPQGWWEGPEKPTNEPWKFHEVNFGQPCADMHVYDYDGDGDADVLSSSAHNFGIWWHENLGENKWKTHEVEKSFSQTHSLTLADIDGDKLPDFVTGKRWWAHGPSGDPGAGDPAVLFWFELRRENGKPVWTPHQIDHDSGVGTQHELADVNGDGLIDIVIGNKKGVFYFEQTRQ